MGGCESLWVWGQAVYVEYEGEEGGSVSVM